MKLFRAKRNLVRLSKFTVFFHGLRENFRKTVQTLAKTVGVLTLDSRGFSPILKSRAKLRKRPFLN